MYMYMFRRALKITPLLIPRIYCLPFDLCLTYCKTLGRTARVPENTKKYSSNLVLPIALFTAVVKKNIYLNCYSRGGIKEREK